MQLSHVQFERNMTNKKLILVCDHIQSPANMGSIFRLADAFNILEIIFYGTTPTLSSNRFKRTARSTERSVRFRESGDITNTIKNLKADGYRTIALEITSQSTPLHSVSSFPEKVALFIGNERSGIESRILKLLDNHVHIDMYGKNSSMNVAQATAIAFYEITRS